MITKKDDYRTKQNKGGKDVKISLAGRLRCPKERYHPELSHHGSQRYQTERDAKEALLLVFESCNCLNFPGAYLVVTALHSGSLLIDWELTFPDSRHGIIQNQFVTSIQKSIEFALQTQQSSLTKSPIDLRDTELVYIKSVDPCSNPERNYCSSNARCIVSNETVGGYICRCNEGYQDISPDPKFHSGEICEEMCDKEYCGRNGNCSIVNNKPICRCDEWYSGKKCRVSVLVLAASVGCVVILVLAIAITFGKYYYNKRKGTFGTFRLKVNSTSNSKVYEEISLSTSKHMEAI